MLARAVVPGSYQVHVSDAGNEASDHRMVSVRLDLTRVRSSPIAGGPVTGSGTHGSAVGTRRGAHRFGWLPDVRAAALDCSGYAVTFLVSRLLLRLLPAEGQGSMTCPVRFLSTVTRASG